MVSRTVGLDQDQHYYNKYHYDYYDCCCCCHCLFFLVCVAGYPASVDKIGCSTGYRMIAKTVPKRDRTVLISAIVVSLWVV